MPVPAVPGFVTVKAPIPDIATSDAGIATVSWLLLMNVVFEVWAAPFQLTTALEPKLDPLTVKVKAGSPAFAVAGFSAATIGTVPATGAVVLELEAQATVKAASVNVSATSKIVVAGFRG